MGSIEKYLEELRDSLEDEVADTFLDAQLHLMKALFAADPSYRKNIENFQGTYWFASKDGDINRIVRFAEGEMTISEGVPPAAHVKVTFKDGRALRRYLLRLKKDLLNLILNHEITVEGNEVYLYKFMFLANHPVHDLLNLQNKYL